jgi:hypothetical protein
LGLLKKKEEEAPGPKRMILPFLGEAKLSALDLELSIVRFIREVEEEYLHCMTNVCKLSDFIMLGKGATDHCGYRSRHP